MNRDLDLLDPLFSQLIKNELLPNCLVRGHKLIAYCTLRDPWEQAQKWRRSRSSVRIHRAAQEMHDGGAPWLSRVLLSVGPQYGLGVTKSLPGRSWHQWGLAVDCFVLNENSGAIWDENHPGFIVYSEEATKLGLTPGRLWEDSVHVQLPKPGVIQSMSWDEIEKNMTERFRND